MTLVVLSYRANWSRYCGRGCNDLLGSGDSDFAMSTQETVEGAAKYIAGRVTYEALKKKFEGGET